MKNQNHIRHIKMVLLKETGDQSLIWPDAYSLRQNYLKHLCGAVMVYMQLWLQCTYKTVVTIKDLRKHLMKHLQIKNPIYKTCIFSAQFVCICAGEREIGCQRGKGTFVGYDKGSPAYIIHFPETGLIKRCRCVRFTDKFENNAESPKPNIHDEVIVNLPPCSLDPQPLNKNHDVVPENPIRKVKIMVLVIPTKLHLIMRVGMPKCQKLGILGVSEQSQST